MAIQQKILFTKGINSDIVDELLEPGQDRYRLNVRVLSSDNATLGAIETVNGTTAVAHTLPAGTNTVIGAKEDLLRKKSYYFLHNSNDLHQILEFNELTNTVTIVFSDDPALILDNQVNILRFKTENLITGINIVELDSDNHLLYWTDNYVDPSDPFIYNEPKKINIEKGILFMAGNYTLGYPSPFDPEILFRIKQPPLCQPTCEYKNDPDVVINYLEQKLFQFKGDYIFDDKEETATSPISKTIYPGCNCGQDQSSKLNNYIAVTIQTGIDIVKRIKIFAKEVNSPDFVEIVDLDKEALGIESNTTYTYNFYNDGNYLPLEVNTSIKLYDRVPKRSQAQEIIEGSRIVDGLITEEFNPVEADLKLNLSLADDVNSPTYSITGLIQIINLCQSSNVAFNRRQPVWSPSNSADQVFFGGIHDDVEGYVGRDGVGSLANYPNQRLPLGGFYVYLAGTSHAGISDQLGTGSYLNTGNNGKHYYKGDTIGQRSDIRSDIVSDLTFSRYTIEGVPAGKYIMRIATEADQSKSTYTMGVAGYAMNECVLEIMKDGTIVIDSTEYDQGDDIPVTYISDMTSGNDNSPNPLTPTVPLYTRYMVVDGYLNDFNGESIELAQINLSRDTSPSEQAAATTAMFLTNQVGTSFVDDKISNIEDYIAICDHNGFFYTATLVGDVFSVTPVSCGMVALDIDSAEIGGLPVTYTVANPGGGTYNPPDCYKSSTAILTKTALDTNNRTYLQGNITFQGSPIKNVKAITTRGGWVSTDVDGNFLLPIYPDTGVDTRSDEVIYSFDGLCIAFWDGTDFEDYSLTFGPNPYYNANHNYLLAQKDVRDILGSSPVNSLKRGGVYLYGLIYYDHGNRSGLTNTNDGKFNVIQPDNRYGTKLFIPFYTEINPDTDLIYGGSYPIVDWEIYNEPMPNMTHYQIARVKDSSTNKYIDFVVDQISYIDDAGSVATFPGSATQMVITVKNIYTTFKEIYPDSILSYDFLKTQRIRFIKDYNGSFFSDYYDFKIKSFDPLTGNIYTEVNNLMPAIGSSGGGQTGGGALFEIYFPKLDIPDNEEITFEIGECYDILIDDNGTPYHSGPVSDQILWTFSDNQFIPSTFSYDLGFIGSLPHGLSIGDKIKVTQDPGFTFPEYNTYFVVTDVPTIYTIAVDGTFLGNTAAQGGTISKCATGKFYSGDTFYRFRNMPFNGVTSPTKLRLIEDSNFSDFYNSQGWDLGRPNRVDPQITEITRPSTIIYSEKLIPETNINGLSSVFDTNFQSYSSSFGGIYKLYFENLRLIIFQEIKVGQVPVAQIIYNDLQLSNTVGASNVVLSPQEIYYAGEYGIGKNPESFAVYANSKYFIDIRRGAVVRLSVDGLISISDTEFMHNYFTDKCKLLLTSPNRTNVYGVYDIKFNEYVIAFADVPDISPAETLAWNEKANAWSTFYSYPPEYMCQNGIDIISFKSGALWKHNTNTIQNTFYGVHTASEIWSIINTNPSNVKVLEAISQETDRNWIITSITTPNGQETRMIYDSNWIERENNQYAFVKRDINTVNVTNPIITGNVMRDRTFLMKLRYDPTEYNKLFAVNAYLIPSQRSNK